MSDWPHAPAADVDDDPSIPLLTDRIYLPAVDLDTALPASLAPAPVASEAAVIADESPQASIDEQAGQPSEANDEPEPVDTEPAPAESDASIEVELDRDLVAASDADFDALLSAETQVVGAEALPAAPAIEEPSAVPDEAEETPTAGTAAAEEPQQAPPANAAAADQAALGLQAEALRAAVLQRVAARLPEQVNAALHDLMQPAINEAMARLGEEAEVALRITLQELVEQALREELQQRSGPSS